MDLLTDKQVMLNKKMKKMKKMKKIKKMKTIRLEGKKELELKLLRKVEYWKNQASVMVVVRLVMMRRLLFEQEKQQQQQQQHALMVEKETHAQTRDGNDWLHEEGLEREASATMRSARVRG